jgi:hypothetical protein
MNERTGNGSKELFKTIIVSLNCNNGMKEEKENHCIGFLTHSLFQ